MPKYKKERFADIVMRYAVHFARNDTQESSAVEEGEEGRIERQARSAEVSDHYYDFASSAYERGWSSHFHYCPFGPGDTIHQAITFYEHRLAVLMGLRPNMKVLDVGCGIGGPAREIARLVGCEIVGISINQRQIDRAVELTAQAGLCHKCTFIKGDFMNLPFPPATFDAAYAIEATVHAPSLKDIYTSINRVLKPQGIIGISEWVLTSTYNPSDSNHIRIRNLIEQGNGITNLQTDTVARKSMIDAGFQIEHDQDFSRHWHANLHWSSSFSSSSTSSSANNNPPNPPKIRDWTYPLRGKLRQTTNLTDFWIVLRLTTCLRFIGYWVIFLLEHLRLYPAGTIVAMDTLAVCVDSVAEGGELGIFSPCWWFVGRKVDILETGIEETSDLIENKD